MKRILYFSIIFFIWVSTSTPVNAQVSLDAVGSLPDLIPESSGLIFYKNKFITHNDSGNAAELYELDTTSLEIVRTVKISNATNVDWEDLAQDDDFIYIGDIGNNKGGRRDLVIYKINKVLYESQNEVEAELISYTYQDQIDFSENSNSDWDAEALIAVKDSLVIFTKQWISQNSNTYHLPKQAGEYRVAPKGAFKIGGLVTGATYDAKADCAYLVGYSSRLQSFITTVTNPLGASSERQEYKKEFLSIGVAQTEGIAFKEENAIYISSERYQNSNPPISLQAQLFRFNTKQLLTKNEILEQEIPKDTIIGANKHSLLIYKSDKHKTIRYDLVTQSPIYGRVIFDALGRRVHFREGSAFENDEISLMAFDNAVYYLTFYLQDAIISKPFLLR